jgi:peptidoglycan/LPS O-acetylase OafA/YrhL
MVFRNDINGLRAFAVISVVLFHFNADWMPGGFAGVDVFFVISGFLMTGIIFKGIESDSFSIIRFYIARANRIVPALALLCVVLLFFGWFQLTPLDYGSLGYHIVSSLSFTSNIIYWKEAGYFDVASHDKWLLHTWSLSVEWQFYIIYPLVLVGFKKIFSIEKVKTFVLVGTVVGFVFCVFATYKWPEASYFLLPTRAWEMMFGGIAYLYPISMDNAKKKAVERLGLALIIGSYFLISKDNYWPGYLALLPVLGTFLIISAQRDDSLITGNFFLQKIGMWSYSIYLWHWPLVVAIYYYSLSYVFVFFALFLSFFLGFLSHRYVERIKFELVVIRLLPILLLL